MSTSNQVDAADLIYLLESSDIKTVTEIQTLINENLQTGNNGLFKFCRATGTPVSNFG